MRRNETEQDRAGESENERKKGGKVNKGISRKAKERLRENYCAAEVLPHTHSLTFAELSVNSATGHQVTVNRYFTQVVMAHQPVVVISTAREEQKEAKAMKKKQKDNRTSESAP